ncbi:MAG: lipoyl(octanoyl) transferase LipB [Verrucomicrobiota bacterium]
MPPPDRAILLDMSTIEPNIDFRWLDRIEYGAALDLQNELVASRQRGEIPDTILLLEHEPVYTIGRTRDRSSLEAAEMLPHPVVEINRGGQATYHGPGQLVGYFILDLVHYGKDLHLFLRQIEMLLIDYTRRLGLEGDRREGLTGVWIEQRKIASIGVGVRKWVSMHGFGLNISRDLSGYDAIVPCGIAGVEMTSIERETGTDLAVSEAARQIEPFIRESLDQLRTTAPHT